MMRTTRQIAGILGVAVLALGLVTGCDDGPAERAGERIDRAVDKLSGKGPVEKAGERIDKAAEELTKK